MDGGENTSKGRDRIAEVVLDERSVIRRSPEVEQERAVAIYDLIEENHFSPVEYPPEAGYGPFNLHLSIEDNRLVLDVRRDCGEPLQRVLLPLSPFRRVIRDYFLICESYYSAIRTSSPSQIEAIDMGRRGLHNEGSELLRERLKKNIRVDFDTARRLFTLVCVLHIRG